MPKLFISYRRSDSEDIAGRIYDRLVGHFGKDSIFFDVDTIPFGIDFRDFLKSEVQQCQVLIAIIGPDWLAAQDGDGRRRIDNTADWVRIEIESALVRNIPVILLLVRKACLPCPDELPHSLQDLAYRNTATARAGRDFHRDMDVLIKGIETLIERFIEAESTQPQSPVGWAPPTTQPQPQPTNPKSKIQNKKSSLPTFEFEVVTVNALGQITEKITKTAEYHTMDLGNGVTLDVVKIPAGQFLMGSPDNEERRYEYEDPQHRVTIPEFWLGKYPVTQAQYQAVMGNNPSFFTKDGVDRPVERVSWHEAAKFCKKISGKTGDTFRLPSEAEWEYACRARTKTPFHFGETISTDLANYDGHFTYGNGREGKSRGETIKVGNFPPNAFGLYDMHGNVWEWCQDIWHEYYDSAPADGTAWMGGDSSFRVTRGGSWLNAPEECRSAFRYRFQRVDFNDSLGFRVCCTTLRQQATALRLL
jgi:formylglycine-generating enzyme required for sulfatase activity